MNERIKELTRVLPYEWVEKSPENIEKFVEIIKQAIYNDVKEELIDDAIINEESDRLSREYLKGCNGGIVDALCHIKNFGVEFEE